MIRMFCLLVALANADQGAAEATDWMKPPSWRGNFWGPAATRARATGQLPPLPSNAKMRRCGTWGRNVLQNGDIVFRLGDARALGGVFPLSRVIAKATGSAFSHTGIVAIEDGAPVVYDCSSAGVQRQPFEVWMLDCIGDFGVKRLKPGYQPHIAGVLGFCRMKFEQQVPFDFEFRPDDAALYCVELTEKAFRSQGLMLSQPVRIGDWECLDRYPLTALAAPVISGLLLEHPITLEQPVFVPGNEHQGIWASSLLEPVVEPHSTSERAMSHLQDRRPSAQGDFELALFVVSEIHRSLSALQVPQATSTISAPVQPRVVSQALRRQRE
jgi:hypothetical protein